MKADLSSARNQLETAVLIPSDGIRDDHLSPQECIEFLDSTFVS